MISTEYERINGSVITNRKIDDVKTNAPKETGSETVSAANRDVFEHSVSETASTYSPETVGKSVGAVYSTTPATTRANTDLKRQNIPTLLAAKMAGVRTTEMCQVIVTGKDDADAMNRAYAEIKGDHAKLSYKKEYCYSQKGSNAYGKTDPENACAAFAFATALSIKYNRKITPAQVDTDSAGGMMDYDEYDGDPVSEWKWNGGTAYRIYSSQTEASTLGGIDAQLQLGNPVLIHTNGTSANGDPSQHWATVIGKENGRYRIIDPWDGSERWLEDMEIYKRNGTIKDYVILTDMY